MALKDNRHKVAFLSSGLQGCTMYTLCIVALGCIAQFVARASGKLRPSSLVGGAGAKVRGKAKKWPSCVLCSISFKSNEPNVTGLAIVLIMTILQHLVIPSACCVQ